MATLKRGVSFRRQGSSGLSWAENWTFTEDGIFQVQRKTSGESSAAAIIIGPQQIAHHTSNPSSASTLSRSSSTGGGGTFNVEVCMETAEHHHKSRSGVIGWIKGRMRKTTARS